MYTQNLSMRVKFLQSLSRCLKLWKEKLSSVSSLNRTREFYNAILAFGPDAEVVSPAAVRREVAERVQQLNATYFDESGILIAL